MYSIKEGNPRKVHYGTTVPKAVLDRAQEDFQQKKITAQDLFWQYHTLAFDTIEYPSKMTFEQVWKKMTRVQKLVLSLGHFVGQVNNGGVWQFFYNRPLYAYTACESLREIHTTVLETKYEKTLEEFGAMIDSGAYHQLTTQLQAADLSDDARWDLFKSGQAHIPSAANFQDYFYQKENKDYFYRKIIRYIHLHVSKLFKVEAPLDENAPKPIPRKEAVQHFTNYLTHAYHQAPDEVRIYYTGRVAVDNQATQLFLMHYKMPDGWESIGITGHFTHHFEDVSLEEINKMYKKYHKQELVNLYHGWYLIQQAELADPTIFEVDKEQWQQVVAHIQAPSHTQIPINVQLLGALRYQGEQWFYYEGDLYYHDDKNPLPEDFPNTAVDDPAFKGERNLLFKTNTKHLPSFGGRMTRYEPVYHKHIPQELIGQQYKLLKDNPWGF